MGEYRKKEKDSFSDLPSSISSPPKKRNGCFWQALNIIKIFILLNAGFWILMIFSVKFSELIGTSPAAQQKKWIQNNMELATSASTACRKHEDKLIASMLGDKVKNPELKLEASKFDSIIFTEMNRYRTRPFPPIESLSFFPHNTEKARAYSSSVALTWQRHFIYVGKNYDTPFPFIGRLVNHDYQVACFVSTDPIRVSAIGVRPLDD